MRFNLAIRREFRTYAAYCVGCGAEVPISLPDEAAAFLDSVTEREFQQALKAMQGRCTVIAIAHRLSTIVDADKILVFGQRRLIEQGTHLELLSKGELYTNLWNSQTIHDVE
jgi:ABC-type multidrug transport system fused ATPase/permease subunit